MRGIRRILGAVINVTAVLSLLTYAVATVLWVRSRWVHDYVYWNGNGEVRCVQSTAGELLIMGIRDLHTNDGRVHWFHEWANDAPLMIVPGAIPFEWGAKHTLPIFGITTREGTQAELIRRAAPDGTTNLGIVDHPARLTTIPWRTVIFLTAILPCVRFLPGLMTLLRAWRRRRQGVGHCASCGYDCRATPDRCPECGRALKVTQNAPRNCECDDPQGVE